MFITSKILWMSAASLAALLLIGLTAALVLVATPPSGIATPKDVFNFATLRRSPTEIDIPALRRYTARDGEPLAYRVYPSSADRILIFVHGSSYHGAGYHALASLISLSGAAKVMLPNLRGHYQSGRRRGDVDYIGQLEDDVVDLIGALRGEGWQGPITLGGHSSGGGFVVRFAGGRHDNLVSSYLLLSPVIPASPAVRQGTAGGWASLNMRRLYGLLMLNAVGIHGLDSLPIVEFNKPAKYWDGTETLVYSYRLNASYHPRHRYVNDIRALTESTNVLVGADDQAVDPEALQMLFKDASPRIGVSVLPGVDHFGIFSDPATLEQIAKWLQSLPLNDK